MWVNINAFLKNPKKVKLINNKFFGKVPVHFFNPYLCISIKNSNAGYTFSNRPEEKYNH